MTCQDLDRWLDGGGPAASHVEAMAHARICARCLAALAATDQLERLLEARTVTAPSGFADRVMARVAMTRQAGVRVPLAEMLPFFQTFPWWVRVAVEPTSLLAILLASVLVWRGDAVFALATTGAAWLANAFPAAGAVAAPGTPGSAPIWLQPTVLTCIVLGTIPLALMGSRLLYRWSATLAGPRHPRGLRALGR